MDESNPQAESMLADLSVQRIGSYRILQPLGSGGMSTVYRAVHLQTGHEVALKVLIRSLARNSTLLQRFLREARSAETLEHPNIVAIFDRGIDEGRHYLVLELVQGGDFHEYVQRNGPLDQSEAIRVIRDVAGGLKYAAGRGLIHRDIKPSNILRTITGHCKIIDLGLALQSEFEDERVTREGTTVGTVDYMAPEQARDSRATSIFSDMYSLGCTFYYLMAGVPPFPGGDITDKLTRHARSPAPDIRDLRPDICAAVASILLRLLAKNPEDRYADYDELIEAIDAAPVPPPDRTPGIALAPLDAEEDNDWPADPAEPGSAPAPDDSASNGSDAALIPMESLAGLAVLAGESEPAPVKAIAHGPATTIPRTHQFDADDAPEEPPSETEILPAPAARSIPSWIVPSSVIGVSLVILAIGVHQFLDGSQGSGIVEEHANGPVPEVVAGPIDGRSGSRGPAFAPDPRLPSIRSRAPVPTKSPDRDRPQPWKEPEDKDPIPGSTSGVVVRSSDFRRYLPEWARSPITGHVETPLVVVRRVAEPGAAAMKPSLPVALDAVVGGTVDLADQGPLPFEDVHISGSRLIRARPGYRPILHVERSNLDPSRQQSSLLNLERKNITLEGIDLIVNVRNLSSRQTTFFGCAGTTLTIRDCTITILNPGNTPFSLIRADSPAAQPTRIRIERSVVRGGFGSGVPVVDLACSHADLVLERAVILCGNGPLVRSSGPVAGSEHQVYCTESVVVGPGPIIDSVKGAGGAKTKPIVFRAYGSAFGRLQGPGIASVISSWDGDRVANRQADWAGDRNVYAGWKGFFARGSESTITVGDLAAVRSTWNTTERDSQEPVLAWPRVGDLATIAPVDLLPFLPDRQQLLDRAPRPRAGLFEKTIGAYPTPAIPEAIEQNSPEPIGQGTGTLQRMINVPKSNPGTPGGNAHPREPRDPTSAGAVVDLALNTKDAPWEGDLGAFMKARLTPAMKHVRIRVEGSGVHRITPVQVPRGIHLEIHAISAPNAEPLSWVADAQTTGPALFDVHGGALILRGLRLHHDPESRLDHLISAEDAHLVVSRCQLTVPPSSSVTGGLISFRARTTEPKPSDPLHPVFTINVDRPVCRLSDSVLIANGTALRMELGRGMVALTECAVAGGDVALDLVPNRVARRRFEVDLLLDHCTLVSERTIVRLGSWPGPAPGPDRPWLISSSYCAFLTLSDRAARDREAVLLRVDADSLAGGTLFWQAANDVHEVDLVTAAGDLPAAPNRSREQWYHFWASNHMSRVLGPRGELRAPNLQLLDRPRPGRIEPADLILNPDYHRGRAVLDVGANLNRQGIVPRAARLARAAISASERSRRRPLPDSRRIH